MNKRTSRYSNEELLEFKKLIMAKIHSAQKQLEQYTQAYINTSTNDDSDTAPLFDPEEGSEASNKEANAELAVRQKKFIRDLRSALARVENKSYGVCQVTGKLIPKERLLLVPHTTMTIEAKERVQKKENRIR